MRMKYGIGMDKYGNMYSSISKARLALGSTQASSQARQRTIPEAGAGQRGDGEETQRLEAA